MAAIHVETKKMGKERKGLQGRQDIGKKGC